MAPRDLVARLGLKRRHWLIVGIIVGAVLGGAVAGTLTTGLGGTTPDLLRIYFVAIVVAAVLSLPAVGFVALIDRRERESPWLYGFAIGWGMVGAVVVSLVLNGAAMHSVFDALADAQSGALSVTGVVDVARLATAIFLGPPIAAVATGVALVLLAFILRGQFFTMRDGIVFGLLVGIGFNLIETPFHVMRGYAETGVAPWNQQVLGRFVFLGISGGALYTALLGAGIGYAVQRGGIRGMLGLIGATVVSIGAHMLHNALTGIVLTVALIGLGYDPGGAGNTAPFLASIPAPAYWLGVALATIVSQWWAYLLLGVLIVRAARYERRVIRHELEDELGISIGPDELDAVEAQGLFGSRRIPGFDRRTNRTLVDAQDRLAFARSRARRHDRDPDTDPRVFARRAEIAWLRAGTPPPSQPPDPVKS